MLGALQRIEQVETRIGDLTSRAPVEDTRLDALMTVVSRAVPIPVYDREVELVFAHIQFSLSIKLDGAVDAAFIRGMVRCTLRFSPGLMRFFTCICDGRLPDKPARIEQRIAPTVRPEYGDVFVAPVKVTHSSDINGIVSFRGENEHFCVYTGREVGQTYVLKIGEAARDRLDALLALAPPQACVVRVGLK
jgi:hypothetical protein